MKIREGDLPGETPVPQVPQQGKGPSLGGSAVHPVPEIVSGMGVSEQELTPGVREVLAKLLSEIEKLRRDGEEARAMLKSAEELADRDPLLPVLNRRAFMREISRAVAYARRYQEPAGLAYFDIDNFKQINDNYGHAVGDAALVHLTQVLAVNIRESDVVGRLGGDEFGVILVRTDESSAHTKAQSLALLISLHPLFINGAEIPLSVSVGAVAISFDDDPEMLLSRADYAMYKAKEAASRSSKRRL